MKKSVWKYEIGIEELDENSEIGIDMPRDAEILYVDYFMGWVTLWALVNPNTGQGDYAFRRFRIAGTGHVVDVMPDTGGVIITRPYLGTAIDRDRNMVWHVFEVGTA